MLNIVLYEPEIPNNTGNIMRLAVNIGATLHLIKPYGFDLEDKKLRRAGLDYLKKAMVREYENFPNFLNLNKTQRIFCFTTKTNQLYTSINYQKNDYLVFGPETRGLPSTLMDNYLKLTIPMYNNYRSINLANAVAIASYEALRQFRFNFS